MEYITEDVVKKNIANLPQLVFEVTDACNLKCKYCAYGEFYGDYDKRQDKLLSVKTAKNLIDYLNKFWKSPACTSASVPMYISFYGGEPLMNFGFIEEIVDYVKHLDITNKKFRFSMTTNGILLHKYMDFLVENKFHLLISLDGNEKNDSYRVDKTGKPSFERVVRNVNLLRETYLDYFLTNVNFNSVFHNRSRMEEVYHFFKDKYGKLPSISELNNSGIREDRIEEFEKTYKNINESLKQSKECEVMEEDMFLKTSGYRDLTLYLHQFSGFYFRDYLDLMADREVIDSVPTGTCSPFGKKMFVTVNGKILPCERIGHQYGLGMVDEDNVHLDFKAIADLYNGLYAKMERQCNSCKIRKACMQCMFNLHDLSGSPKCHGYMTKEAFERYRQRQMDFIAKHPSAYRKIMEHSITI